MNLKVCLQSVLMALVLISYNPELGHCQEVETSRDAAKSISQPQEPEGFCFGIFSDRTGSNEEEGYMVFEKAISQVNAMRPEFVFTVGDLIQGYGDNESWASEANRCHEILKTLKVDLFPVAGNHEIYWKNDYKGIVSPHHEKEYEKYFGPLWYAFEYKNCWFISLFTDEGNPETGERTYNTPNAQKMSEEQFTWLKSVLGKAKDADQVFIFQHHPRWNGGGYGDDWDRVHEILVKAGNVSAVFAGHVHKHSYVKIDGIDYYSLLTTGGTMQETTTVGRIANSLARAASSTGTEEAWTPEYSWFWVSVTKDDYDITLLPISKLKDVRQLTQ